MSLTNWPTELGRWQRSRIMKERAFQAPEHRWTQGEEPLEWWYFKVLQGTVWHISLWKQESPGPLTHLSCLHITHCRPELSDKSPIPSAGSSHSKETCSLTYSLSSLMLSSAFWTPGAPAQGEPSHQIPGLTPPGSPSSPQLLPNPYFLLPALDFSSCLPNSSPLLSWFSLSPILLDSKDLLSQYTHSETLNYFLNSELQVTGELWILLLTWKSAGAINI